MSWAYQIHYPIVLILLGPKSWSFFEVYVNMMLLGLDISKDNYVKFCLKNGILLNWWQNRYHNLEIQIPLPDPPVLCFADFLQFSSVPTLLLPSFLLLLFLLLLFLTWRHIAGILHRSPESNRKLVKEWRHTCHFITPWRPFETFQICGKFSNFVCLFIFVCLWFHHTKDQGDLPFLYYITCRHENTYRHLCAFSIHLGI